MPSCPLPANRSSTFAPGNWNCSALNIASLTRAMVGRVTSSPGSVASGGYRGPCLQLHAWAVLLLSARHRAHRFLSFLGFSLRRACCFIMAAFRLFVKGKSFIEKRALVGSVRRRSPVKIPVNALGHGRADAVRHRQLIRACLAHRPHRFEMGQQGFGRGRADAGHLRQRGCIGLFFFCCHRW